MYTDCTNRALREGPRIFVAFVRLRWRLGRRRLQRRNHQGGELLVTGHRQVTQCQALGAMALYRHHRRFVQNHLVAERVPARQLLRSEEHTSELQSLMHISYAVFCLKKKITTSYSPTKTHIKIH